MSSTTPCLPTCCSEAIVTEVPGPSGAGAFTVTTASFVVPAVGANVTVAVGSTDFMSAALDLWIPSANYTVAAVLTPTSVSITNQGFSGDTAPGTVIPAGTLVVAGLGNFDIPLSIANGGTGAATQAAALAAILGASVIGFANGGTNAATRLGAITALTANALAAVNNFTDNTTGTAGDTLAAGVGVYTLAIPIQLAAMTTAAADLITGYVPGHRFKLLSCSFLTTTLGTGAGASQVLNFEINATNLTGGVLTLTLATTTPLGNQIAATAITAANVGAVGDSLSLEVAAGGTVFTAGAGVILVKIQNLDSADAAASFSSKVNSLLDALTT